MSYEIIILIVGCVVAVFIITFFLVGARIFSKKFSKIEKVMSYEKVIEILGQPEESAYDQGIRTCVWSRAVIRSITNSYTVVFSNGVVVSIVKHIV